ncbi:MAG: tape measure protein, partial [Tannerella sp.]|nr:tape measure protein [Tannerella sp.]
MARLALHVSSDLGGLKMLEKEIERTKKAIIDLYGAGNSSAAKSMEAYLHRLMKQHSQLYESLKPVIYQYQQLERAGVSSLGNLGRAAEGSASGFDRLRNSLAGLAAGFSLSRFIGEVVNVRGEIQQLGIAFETMLGSKSDAEKMMSDIAEFAQKTPFTLTEVANNTKQLMAMGIASENVMDTMKALGDVAAGLSVPISRLAVNYGQVATLGKLQSREIRDFAMAGVPVLDELARMLGKSKDEISAMSEAGQIGFPLVEQAFKNMSSEGGKFYNMMENQNASVTGQISKLKDQIQAMMNEIGSSGEGAIYGAVNLSSELVKNYKQVGETIAALTAVWGTYRVALMATTAVESARAAVLEKQLTDESLQNVSRSNLTRGTMAYTAALKTELIAQQQRELSILKQTGMEQRRNYVQLQSQLVTAQQAIIDAKANGVKEKRIRQLQREASAISVRIQAARADMIATAKSITAKQAEIAANTGNVASTNLLTVAKNRLALATRRLTAAMMNNPYTVAAVAVVALGYGIYKLVTHMTDAEKAQKRLIDLNSEYTKSLASEQVQIRVLFDRIKSAKKGTEEYERAKKGIMSLADSYQAGLSSEIDLVNDLAGAYDKVSGAAQNAAKSRAIEKGTREAADTYADEWNENITSIRGMFIKKFGEAGGEAILQDLKYALESGGAFSEELKKAIAEFNTRIQQQQGLSTNAVFTDYNPVDEYIERIRKSKEILDDEIKEINSIYKIGEKPAEESGSDAEKQFIDVAKEIENAKKKVADFKQEIEDLRSGKTQVEAGQNLTE